MCAFIYSSRKISAVSKFGSANYQVGRMKDFKFVAELGSADLIFSFV
jgi:hypothetical protein